MLDNLLNYEFPRITCLDDVREVLKTDGFALLDKGEYQVVNYHYGSLFEGSFPTPLHRECRGLIFDKEGKLLSRRFHKFFNLGEHESLGEKEVSWMMEEIPYIIYEKLDGSMVSPVVLNNIFYLITKQGITDVSVPATSFAYENPNFIEFSKLVMSLGQTPIFEWLSPDNRIVIGYPEPRLVLLAIRDNLTGKYSDLETVKEALELYNIQMPKTFKSYKDLPSEDFEGVVIWFDTGHMVKVKTTWYVRLHAARDSLSYPHRMLFNLWNGLMDDVIPLLSMEDKKRLEEFKEEFDRKVTIFTEHAFNTLDRLDECETKKEFALKLLSFNSNPNLNAILFRYFDGKGTMAGLIKEAINHLVQRNSKAAYENLLEVLG